MHALFDFDPNSTLYALIRYCTLIYFSGFFKKSGQFWQKLGLSSDNFCLFGDKKEEEFFTIFYLIHRCPVERLHIDKRKVSDFSFLLRQLIEI